MSESKRVVVRSPANPKVKHLLRMRDNRARRRAGRVLVDGSREASLAITAGLRLRQVYLPESIHPSHPLLEELPCEQIVWLSDAMMQKVGYGDSYRDVVVEFDRPRRALEDLQVQRQAFILVLDQIEKPGNVGALFRCADAAGVDAVLLCQSGDVFNPNAIRSSIGTVFHVPSAEGTEAELRSFLFNHNVRIIAARVESSRSLWKTSLQDGCALVLGSEANGLAERWQPTSEQPVEAVRIPMAGQIDSLNVSVSAAVILFEAVRQRDRSGNARN